MNFPCPPQPEPNKADSCCRHLHMDATNKYRFDCKAGQGLEHNEPDFVVDYCIAYPEKGCEAREEWTEKEKTAREEWKKNLVKRINHGMQAVQKAVSAEKYSLDCPCCGKARITIHLKDVRRSRAVCATPDCFDVVF